jgi:hypothetical protein
LVPAELVLALFVAPVLLDAAYDTSLRDLTGNWGAVTSLVLIAVGLTTIAGLDGPCTGPGYPLGGRDCGGRDRGPA